MPYKDTEKDRAYHKKYVRAWYIRNKDKVLACRKRYRALKCNELAALAASRYHTGREFVNAQKSKPCTDCKQVLPFYVMQFDHLRDKKFNISGSKNRNIQSLQVEMDKCELVCANCHASRTYHRTQYDILERWAFKAGCY